MPRNFAVKTVHYLLTISLLMLVLGSAWHVHDHHTHKADACLWCLAALAVAVLVSAVVLTGALQVNRRAYLLHFSQNIESHSWSPIASRAPPVL